MPKSGREVEYMTDEDREAGILKARNALGANGKPIEQRRLANLLGVHPSLMNRYERKREKIPPDISILCRVIVAAQRAGRLDIINEALGGEGNPAGAFDADGIVRSSDGDTWTVGHKDGEPVPPFEMIRGILGFAVELAGRIKPDGDVETDTRSTIIRGASDGVAWCYRVAAERLALKAGGG